MVSIFSLGLLSLHILKKYAILSLEKAVLATFWASSLRGARIRHKLQNPVYLDFSNHLGCQLTENKRENFPPSEGYPLTAQPGLLVKYSASHSLSKKYIFLITQLGLTLKPEVR